MDTITKTVKTVEKITSQNLGKLLDIPLVAFFLSFLVIVNVYISFEEFPVKVKDILYNKYYRASILFLSLYASTRDLYMSFGATVFVLFSSNLIKQMKEGFELINPSFNSHPGCLDIKVTDLLNMFEGDRYKLKKAMEVSRVPYNLKLTDFDAPLIATYLVQNKSYPVIGEKCGKN